MTPYRVFLAREIVESLRKLPLRQRQELTKFVERLEEAPSSVAITPNAMKRTAPSKSASSVATRFATGLITR